MIEHWQSFVANFAVVALFVSIWVNGQFAIGRRPKAWRNAAFGLLMGAGAVASMVFAVQINGALLDLRITLIAIAAFLGGPVAALLAGLVALIYRVGVVGGPLVGTAILSICGAAALGLASWWPTRTRQATKAEGALLALGVLLFSIALLLLGSVMRGTAITSAALPLAVLNSAATLVACLYFIRQRDIENERDLLRGAFVHAPDVQFIKTTESRFLAVNKMLATRSGYKEPAEMVGKSDFDIIEPDFAKTILADDQELIATDRPKINFEEMVRSPAGEEIWYRTSKVPLHDSDGNVVGLAGWSQIITRQKQLEKDVIDSRNQLNYVLTEMSDGIAMFDAQGTLTYCNERYSRMFPLTQDVRRPGQHFRDILREVVARGEQRGAKPGREQEWIDKIAASLKVMGEEEVELLDGSWLSVRTRPTSDGSSLVMVTDVTKIKEANHALKAMTEQLKLLATTDGLTGLANRRAFDETFERELDRSRRTGTPLALLLVDVDRFKAYNDYYGHQEGDRVLKAVAQCLAGAMRRPTDFVARYGGEEFVALLPGTDEDGAYFVADGFRETLRSMGIAHNGSEKQLVTASVGIATFTERDAGIRSADLIRRADEALYSAKAAGRDRVLGWRPRRESERSLGA